MSMHCNNPLVHSAHSISSEAGRPKVLTCLGRDVLPCFKDGAHEPHPWTGDRTGQLRYCEGIGQLSAMQAKVDKVLDALPDTERASVLNEANQLVHGDRQVQYGSPTANFENTASILNTLGFQRVTPELVGNPVTAVDVGVMMLALKLARLAGDGMKRDTLVDLAGYAACTWECQAKEDGNG